MALRLPMGELKGSDKELKALRNIIDRFPWILRVADCDYDKKVAVTHMIAAAQVNCAELAIEEYKDKKK